MPRKSKDMDVLLEFGNKLQWWLDKRGETNTSYCAYRSIDLSTLGKILKGQRNLTLGVLGRVISPLGLTLSEFFAGKEMAELERRFSEEFELFRHALTVADRDGLKELRRTMERIIRESREARERSGPDQIPKAESSR